MTVDYFYDGFNFFDNEFPLTRLITGGSGMATGSGFFNATSNALGFVVNDGPVRIVVDVEFPSIVQAANIGPVPFFSDPPGFEGFVTLKSNAFMSSVLSFEIIGDPDNPSAIEFDIHGTDRIQAGPGWTFELQVTGTATRVPEPSTLLLLGTGLTGLGFFRSRRKAA